MWNTNKLLYHIFFLNTYLDAFWYNNFKVSEGLNSSFLTAAPVEESLKLSVLYFLVYKMREFNEPLDGVVYGVCASLGFATLENLYYVYVLADYYQTSSMSLAIIRSFSAVPACCVWSFYGLFFYEIFIYQKR